ncbi:MAG: hypothetical protein WA082_03580 [Candidatus Moraniibacteriota bacterium]
MDSMVVFPVPSSLPDLEIQWTDGVPPVGTRVSLYLDRALETRDGSSRSRDLSLGVSYRDQEAKSGSRRVHLVEFNIESSDTRENELAGILKQVSCLELHGTPDGDIRAELSYRDWEGTERFFVLKGMEVFSPTELLAK